MIKRIKPMLDLNNDFLSKKLRKLGISKDNAEELTFHFFEIERFCLGFNNSIINILKAKNNEKNKIREELDSIFSELEFHIIKNHLIPAKKLIDKINQSLD